MTDPETNRGKVAGSEIAPEASRGASGLAVSLMMESRRLEAMIEELKKSGHDSTSVEGFLAGLTENLEGIDRQLRSATQSLSKELGLSTQQVDILVAKHRYPEQFKQRG